MRGGFFFGVEEGGWLEREREVQQRDKARCQLYRCGLSDFVVEGTYARVCGSRVGRGGFGWRVKLTVLWRGAVLTYRVGQFLSSRLTGREFGGSIVAGESGSAVGE